MTTSNKSVEPEHIACEICLKEVPLSEAINPETEDYVVHFCGLDCYEKWKGQDEKHGDSIKKPGD
jgi:hypothetical protein